MRSALAGRAVITAGLASTVALLASMAVPGLASEHGATGHDGAGGFGTLPFQLVNFSIFAALIVWKAVPPLREHLRRRREDITALAEGARVALAAAEQSLEQWRRRLASVRSEGEAIQLELLDAAARHAERVRAEAKASGQRRLADAALVAEQERRRAFATVRAEVAALATELAEKQIRGSLTPADQLGFLQRFLQDATQ